MVLIGILAISTPLYIYIFVLIKLYLDILNDSNKSSFYLHLNYLDSTSKYVRCMLKIWEISAL